MTTGGEKMVNASSVDEEPAFLIGNALLDDCAPFLP